MDSAAKAPAIATRIERLRLKDLKLLPLNARFMRHETFQTLVANIRRDGCLTSVPFAIRDEDGRYLVLSGNHRVKAGIEAGVEEADVMVTDDPLPKDRRLAIQLAHNALVGEDDPTTLKRLYEEIEAIDWKVYAGLDDKTLDSLQKVNVGALGSVNLAFQTIHVAFLPDELDAAKQVWDEVKKLCGGAIWAARFREYDAFLDALETTGGATGVRNIATSLLAVLEIFRRHQTDLAEAWFDPAKEAASRSGWVPLATVLGTDQIPADAAAVIKRAVDKMRDAGDVDSKTLWKAIEFWAAEYLAGAER